MNCGNTYPEVTGTALRQGLFPVQHPQGKHEEEFEITGWLKL